MQLIHSFLIKGFLDPTGFIQEMIKLPPLLNVKLFEAGGANRWEALIYQGISQIYRNQT